MPLYLARLRCLVYPLSEIRLKETIRGTGGDYKPGAAPSARGFVHGGLTDGLMPEHPKAAACSERIYPVYPEGS